MLEELLRQEIKSTARLLELLQTEYDILKSGQAQDLQAIVDAKQGCIDTLQSLARRRGEHLLEQGLTPDAQGMAAYIQAQDAPRSESLARVWDELRQLAQHTRQRNEVNGAIIHAGRRFTEQVLGMLRGGDPQSCVYGHNARPSMSTGRRQLGSA